MRTKNELSEMSPVEAYNLAVNDCLESASIKCVGDRETMSLNNCSPKDERFFDVDPASITQNLITEGVAPA